LTSVYQSAVSLKRISVSSSSVLYVAGEDGIRKINNDGTASTILPNGPWANQSWGLAVDGSGTLWVGTGDDDAGVGFYKYSNNTWTNYNTSNTPAIPNNGYFSAFCSGDGNTYIGNWGTGFLRIKDTVLTVFRPENTGMTGIPNSTNFLVVSGFANDSKGNLWILNYWPGDRRPLTMFATDSSRYNFYSSAESTPYEQHFNLVIDPYDTKWYCIKDPAKSGLFYFNENKTYSTTSDDRAGYLTTSNGLSSNTINSIVVDRRGEIWVGTPSGANVISNTSTIPSTYSSASLKISTVYALRQQSINCIAVDPLNQKWVGTNQGLLLVNSDGSSLLASFTTENSPLMTDVIKSITIDPNSGVVYAGTELGMIKFQTLGIMPRDNFTELFVYPSPFLLKSSENVLTIDGLIRDTDIKILSTSGKLINEFSSPGGYRATWNGTDMDGKLVSSGVYFIIAYDKEGNNVTTAKVAVLR
jgi:ligand-binding sensor domain-containing protein